MATFTNAAAYAWRLPMADLAPEQQDERRKYNRDKSAKWRAANPERHRAQLVKYWAANKEKLRLRALAWKHAHKPYLAEYKRSHRGGINRDYNLRTKYKITPAIFDAMVEKQGSRCDVCKSPLDFTGHGRVHLDHDHKTGAVRGVLCRPCNTGLGFFRDSQEVLQSAIGYLTKHNCTKVTPA